ncbi:hypothetical protein LguiB_003849 [Lonicera macranthoides]
MWHRSGGRVVKRWIEESKVAGGMLLVQLFATGMQLLSKVILNQGIFVFALITYRHILAAFCVAPFAFYFDRGNFKKLSWLAFFWLFITALTGISMAMGFYYFGLRDTTATYATNFLNLIPIVTFFFSTVLRIEKLRLGTKVGKIKMVGAILCLTGALTMSLYKGKSFHISSHQSTSHVNMKKASINQTRGTLFLVTSILSYGFWFIVQVKLFKVFPYKYCATLLVCIIASLQQLAIGLCIDRSKKAWKLGWNLQLITIFYSGALATAATFCLISWAIAQRGPTYPSMFNPIALILVAITGTLFLGEEITVGSLAGMSLVIVGLYSFLWAKNKEFKSMTRTPPLPLPLSKPPQGAADESERTESAAAAMKQLTAIVVPSASPSNDTNTVTNEDQR